MASKIVHTVTRGPVFKYEEVEAYFLKELVGDNHVLKNELTKAMDALSALPPQHKAEAIQSFRATCVYIQAQNAIETEEAARLAEAQLAVAQAKLSLALDRLAEAATGTRRLQEQLNTLMAQLAG